MTKCCAFCNDTKRIRLPKPVELSPQRKVSDVIQLEYAEFDCPNCSSFGYSEIEPVYITRMIDASTYNSAASQEDVIKYEQRHMAMDMALYLLGNGFIRKSMDDGQPYRDQDEIRLDLRLGVVNPDKLRKVEARDNEIRLACLEDFLHDVRAEMLKMGDWTGWWHASAPIIDRMMTTVYERIRTQLEQDNAQTEQIDRRDAEAATGHE